MNMTLIMVNDRTYVLPTEPKQCGCCGAMSGAFINRLGATCCVRCDVEDRTQERMQGHAYESKQDFR
jgi:hypothetical protein